MSNNLKSWLARNPARRRSEVTLCSDGKWNVRIVEMVGGVHHVGEYAHEDFDVAFLKASEQHREQVAHA